MQRVTIKDIAREAGVSVTTVSRALNGSPEISEDTRKRVLKLCRSMGYHTNLLAKSLISSRTNVVGVIQPELNSPFHAALALHIETCAREQGFQVMLCRGKPSDEDIHALFDFLLGQRVDGILMASSSNFVYGLLEKYQTAVPAVLLGACPPEDCPQRINSVSTDNYTGGMLAARYLHGLGHRRVAYLGMRRNSTTHQLRYQGFCDAAAKLGMTVTTLENPTFASTIDVGLNLGRRLLGQLRGESAVFAVSDLAALGFMQACDEQGISIPGQISLLGFDNIDYAAVGSVQLTTFSQRPDALAQASIRLLQELIENNESAGCTRKLLLPSLVERSSCRALKDGEG